MRQSALGATTVRWAGKAYRRRRLLFIMSVVIVLLHMRK
jgi:hypothetical protein